MEIVVIVIVAFLTAILTFFSGFGLGTILTPVFMIFFPVDLAIALTGVVHFFNNIFKIILVGKNADKTVIIRFGIPAVAASFIGAWLLLHIPDTSPLFAYTMFGKTFEVYPVKLIISILLIIFASMDLIPFFTKLQFGREKLPLGGALSGFFGGLSGNQGALRSAFLIKAGLTKEAFIGTAVVVSTFVDFTRLSVYATRFLKSGLTENISLVVYATLGAIAGAYFGKKLLKKVTIRYIQILVAVMLIIISLALGTGIL
ncbi:MAG TPA: sulfite exporter TauE/SafE family protein [Tenuifilaceae bacterium]|nr:sulfite exporter TauE/SafE family protein [Tenuifilaceae bacterium]HPE19542.1 sulfite exporter TauE/SafE family protein [Tenuifilaceae bacterium]HPJ47079.1 sulfite exporter TauE/SafE family protein [Tenuifilaceae bacterium]HPQ34834.1 sulfite exporter TauE/SafE family protein [Tenuifilaceae bacterium]HRX68717.1 sulfite exporter TauE/SafE family protein [Tenuifilaceae bacterium]